MRNLRVLVIGLFLFSLMGCGGSAIRDTGTYAAEVDYVDHASAEQVERGIALIKASCKCEAYGVLAPQFVTKECAEMAETIQVVRARTKYHTDFMRYLGGLTEVRPPKTPPPVPGTSELCKEIE